MRVNHFQMTLVHRQIHWLTYCAARVMDIWAIVGQLHKILEIFQRAITAAFIDIMHKWRAVVGCKNCVLAADNHRTFKVAGVLGILRRRSLAKFARQAARKAHALAFNIGTGSFEQFQRVGIFTHFNANRFEQRFGVVGNLAQGFRRKHFKHRDIAADVGNGNVGAGTARLAACFTAASGVRIPGLRSGGFWAGGAEMLTHSVSPNRVILDSI